VALTAEGAYMPVSGAQEAYRQVLLALVWECWAEQEQASWALLFFYLFRPTRKSSQPLLLLSKKESCFLKRF
jgi:hypothetical protein